MKKEDCFEAPSVLIAGGSKSWKDLERNANPLLGGGFTCFFNFHPYLGK